MCRISSTPNWAALTEKHFWEIWSIVKAEWKLEWVQNMWLTTYVYVIS